MILNYTPYTINDLDTILSKIDVVKDFVKNTKKEEFLNIPISFDIETSSFINYGEKVAIMYAFVICINGECVIGRNWKEVKLIFGKLVDYLGLWKDRRCIIYVHNLSYEFQFMRNHFLWEKVFSIDERKPIYAITEDGIEFRCSYLLTGYSLNNVAKNLHKYQIKKMVGDLDYSKIRHEDTPLTKEEVGYIINDGLIVVAKIDEEIEYNGNITKIPLTKTGYVRRYCRKECMNDKKNVSKWKSYRYLMNSLTITSVLEYEQLKRAFCGGFTHANALAVGTIQYNVRSFDFTSSYPYVMVSEKFPMSKGEKVKIKNKEDLLKNLKNYCCIFDVSFYDLESITSVEHPLSYSKCFNTDDVEIDNGRVVSAKMVSTTITEQDYFIFSRFYSWKNMKIKNFRRYKKGYLPTDLVKAILKEYEKKTKLKGVAGEEVEYLKSKENVNSIYGMMVTDIARDEVIYDNISWSTQKVLNDALKEVLEKYNKSKKRFLFYAWGIWVTAYARRNLFTGIYELGEDYIYSDTDSVKFINYEKHKDYFNKYNERVIVKLKNAMHFHKLPFEMVSPKTIKGEVKTLGLWDDDGSYKYFKTLGAKRYMNVDYNDNLNVTISGVSKVYSVKYLRYMYKDSLNILNHFENGLIFPSSYMYENEVESATGKQIHTYIDDVRKGVITDYLGNKREYIERSSIHLSGADYELSLSNDFIDYLLDIKEYNK